MDAREAADFRAIVNSIFERLETAARTIKSFKRAGGTPQ
jgi:tRNA threonylcarbamoyladenosine modification (KEOPS) complex  Pcc1 subunit